MSETFITITVLYLSVSVFISLLLATGSDDDIKKYYPWIFWWPIGVFKFLCKSFVKMVTTW